MQLMMRLVPILSDLVIESLNFSWHFDRIQILLCLFL